MFQDRRMSLRSLCLSTLLLCFHLIFGPHTVVASGPSGTLKFYDDWNCENPSTLNPTVSLGLSTCLVTPGGGGLVLAAVPPCPQGSAVPIFYSDPACGVQTSNVITSIFSNNCYELAAGTDIYNGKSLMLSCQAAADNPLPSSTTTAVISGLAAVATGSSSSNGGGSASGSGSGSGSSVSSASDSSSTGTTTQQNSNGSSSSSSSKGATTTSATSASGSGLDTGDIIALAVGLGVGIPSIIVAILAWRFPTVRNKVASLIPGFSSHPADPQLYPPPHHQQWPHSRPQELQSQYSGSQQHFAHQAPQEMDSQPMKSGRYY